MKSEPKHIFRNNGILIGLGLIILFGSILYASLTSTTNTSFDDNTNFRTSGNVSDDSEMFFSNNLYSGPFAILEGTYGVDDCIFHW